MHLRAPDESLDHTVEAVERFVEVASERGVDEIGFTEHVYYFEQTKALWSIPYQLERCVYDIEPYVDAVVEAKRQGYPVKLGIEVDHQPQLADEMADVLGPYPWDYLLGSVHFVDGLAIDQEPSLISAVGSDGAWYRYFGWLEDAINYVDVLAHPDLIKYFGGFVPPETAEHEYVTLAEFCAAAGVALEVSTAGLYKPHGELYPSADLLRIAAETRTPITLASDAHVPQHVGRDLHRAIEHARSAGYETVTVFERRESRQEPLG
jgi:histidinol-phosphatase (PHP family)